MIRQKNRNHRKMQEKLISNMEKDKKIECKCRGCEQGERCICGKRYCYGEYCMKPQDTPEDSLGEGWEHLASADYRGYRYYAKNGKIVERKPIDIANDLPVKCGATHILRSDLTYADRKTLEFVFQLQIDKAKQEGYEEGLRHKNDHEGATQIAVWMHEGKKRAAKEIREKIKAAKTILSEKRDNGVVMQIVDAAIDGDALIAQIEQDYEIS